MKDANDYVDRLRAHYAPLLAKHGTSSHRSVDWGSARSQHRRFDVLLQALSRTPATLLDIGCGVGELAAYLGARGYTTAYHGLDPLPEMIAAARQRFPERSFDAGLLAAGGSSPRAELVVASGVFAFCEAPLMHQTLRAMFAACDVAVAFNALSGWAPHREEGEFYHDPLATLAFCRELTPRVALRHDYLPHDFTIYLYREANA
ncbi:MAG TPA: class I SAM-dependent methyltransferase [Candidatus Baltobacteraceae bacterium]|nr:class I SAM-dependent methyltransferase [Candidatus Baltobacteraceae bacterium]